MGFREAIRSWFFEELTAPVPAAPPIIDTRSHKSVGSMATGGGSGSRYGVLEPRRGARTMRRFSETNVWVRTAINRRKREISRAKWAIVRVDDPKATPNPKIVKRAADLFNFINETRVSLSWLLNVLVEDILVLDAGVFEKETTAGGELAALWWVDGATILPLEEWKGSPRADRYVQVIEGRKVAAFKNDELTYIMANPRSCSVVGLSPLEVLFDTVEADLYGSDLEYRMMQETAPPGILYLGAGVTPEQTDAFRAQWENDIAGNRDIAMLGGTMAMDGNGQAQAPMYIPFSRSSRDEERRDYMKWLATKVAAAFEMDLLAFNLSESIHRSVGETLRSKTDDGLLGLADLIADFITREVIWELDPTHTHGFVFKDLIKRDAMVEAQVRQIYMNMGCTFPNEIRAEMGQSNVEWGDIPYPSVQATGTDPAEEDLSASDDGKTGPKKKPDPDDTKAKK